MSSSTKDSRIFRMCDCASYTRSSAQPSRRLSPGIRLGSRAKGARMSPDSAFWNLNALVQEKPGLCGNGDSKFDPMSVSVTVNAERNQIFRCIMAEFTSKKNMMNLQHFCGTAILASPSIPVQNLNFERIVPLWI